MTFRLFPDFSQFPLIVGKGELNTTRRLFINGWDKVSYCRDRCLETIHFLNSSVYNGANLAVRFELEGCRFWEVREMLVDHKKISEANYENVNNEEPVYKWMTPDPITLLVSQSLREAITLLETYHIDGLPVISPERHVIGLITKSRLMKCFAEGISPDTAVAEVMNVRQFRDNIDAGMLGVNMGVPAPMAFFPFSGYKKSFYGDLHANGRDGVEFYTRKKMLTARY